MTRESRVVDKSRVKRFVVKQATHDYEIEAALRLRFEVFNLEMNEGLRTSYNTGIDWDEYDALCDHVIVLDESKGMVVGAYRMLLGSEAEKHIGYYSESEFEMSALRKLKGRKLELGRACVHKDYRGTAALGLMWSGIASHIEAHNIDYVFGCGSIHTINASVISSVYSYLREKYLSDVMSRVTPLRKVPGFDPHAAIDKHLVALHLPPLLGAYLRLGAQICGEPAFDEQFGVADLFVLLERDKLLSRYRNRFF
jgi:L-ornithine Nalpha-acyltransferase